MPPDNCYDAFTSPSLPPSVCNLSARPCSSMQMHARACSTRLFWTETYVLRIVLENWYSRLSTSRGTNFPARVVRATATLRPRIMCGLLIIPSFSSRTPRAARQWCISLMALLFPFKRRLRVQKTFLFKSKANIHIKKILLKLNGDTTC